MARPLVDQLDSAVRMAKVDAFLIEIGPNKCGNRDKIFPVARSWVHGHVEDMDGLGYNLALEMPPALSLGFSIPAKVFN